MKLIIDIPEDLYKWIKDKYDNPNGEVAYSAIKNGIPYERKPHSEWVGNAFDEHHCKRCGHPALWEEEPDGYYEVQSRFCPNCGLPMKKGGAE